MPKLQVNALGEYYTTYSTGSGPRVIHFNDGIRTYLKKKRIKIGDELPHSWRSDTACWQYTHGIVGPTSAQSGLVNTRCPVCGKQVFYYTNEYGSKVYFDHAGDTWPKHPCTTNGTSYIQRGHLIRISTPKIIICKSSSFFIADNLSFETTNFRMPDTKKNCQFFIHKIDQTFETLVITSKSSTKEVKIKNCIKVQPTPTPHKTTKPPLISFAPVETCKKIDIASITFDNHLMYIEIKNSNIYKVSTKFKKIIIDKTSEASIVFCNSTAKSIKIKTGDTIEEYKIENFYYKEYSKDAFKNSLPPKSSL